MNTVTNDSFYVVAREPGAENPSLPTWANHNANPAALDENYPVETVRRVDIDTVPGAFQLINLLSPQECKALIQLSEARGYLKDAAVSLPRDIRHNDNVTWVTDEATDSIIYQRASHLLEDRLGIFGGHKPLGINARFRFYRYEVGDFFKRHTDGAWPGSRVIDGGLVTNAYPDRYSLMSFLILLNEDFDGGATRFFVNVDNPLRPARHGERTNAVDVRTPAGAVLCFPHGMHPMHCIHSSEPISQGVKYIIRTDLLFET
jgi:hypothetical protein